MHLLTALTVFVVLTLIGVEFSVAAFVDPAAWRLDAGPQSQMLSRMALVLGRVMPAWYPVCALLLGVQAWLRWHAPHAGLVLGAFALWLVASLASIAFLVPLNSRIAQGATDWQTLHRIWDGRHRVRVAALAVAGLLFTYAAMC